MERIDESVRFKVLLEQLEDEAERLVTDHVALGQKMGGVQGDLMDCLKSLRGGLVRLRERFKK